MLTSRRATRGDEKSEEIKIKVFKQTRRRLQAQTMNKRGKKCGGGEEESRQNTEIHLMMMEKLTNKPNPPLPMTAQANCCSPLKRGHRWRLPSALELNSWNPSGFKSHDLSRAAIQDCGIGADFLFFYKLTAHDYLYWALWAATESNPLRGGGCESGRAQSGTLLKREGRPTHQHKKRGERAKLIWNSHSPHKKIWFTLR